MSTLASSFIGVVPFNMLLFRNIGRVGGGCTVEAMMLACPKRGESSGESKSMRN
jgi:hypothetical protein